MSLSADEQILRALDSLQESTSVPPVHRPVPSNPFAYPRQEPFRPTFAAAYLAWAEVGMIAPLLGRTPGMSAEFIDTMRMGLGTLIAGLEESRKSGIAFYGIQTDELLQTLYGTDLKLQGYPDLLKAYEDSKVELQEALRAALPEAALSLDVGKEQLKPLKPVYFRHFMWVGRQMLFELALLDVHKAKAFSGILVDAENCYRHLIEETQAEALNEGMKVLEEIHLLLCRISESSDQIREDQNLLNSFQNDLPSLQSELDDLTSWIQTLVQTFQQNQKCMEDALTLATEAFREFSNPRILLQATEFSPEAHVAFERLMEASGSLQASSEKLCDLPSQISGLRDGLGTLAEQRAHGYVLKGQIQEIQQGLSEASQRVRAGVCTLERHMTDLEELCKFPGQARILEEDVEDVEVLEEE